VKAKKNNGDKVGFRQNEENMSVVKNERRKRAIGVGIIEDVR